MNEHYKKLAAHIDFINGFPVWVKVPYKSSVKIGAIAGCISGNGYRHILCSCDGVQKTILVHRLCWFKYNNEIDGIEIDHIDRNKENNSIENLRTATKSQNARNQTKRKGCTSEYMGISKKRGKYESRIKLHGKLIHIGTFVNEIEAAKAYDAKAIELGLGDFANLNFKVSKCS